MAETNQERAERTRRDEDEQYGRPLFPKAPAPPAAPPVFVSGGKRLNFDRHDIWDETLSETFHGFGKEEGCSASGTWDELCALATVIVAHPAYRPVTKLSGYYQPETQDGETTSGGER